MPKILVPYNVFARRILIALSDGHGALTAGKRTPNFPEGGYMPENEFNSRVVAILKEELERCGFEVLLVAPTSADTPLTTRTNLANSRKADLYLSVHANAFRGVWDDAQGIETFTSGSGEGLRIGKLIHAELLKGSVLANRGMKNGMHLHEIKATNMPAVLVECGFMDNLREARLLDSEAYRRESALELAYGVCKAYKVNYVPKPKPVAKPVAVAAKPTLYRVQVGAFGVEANAEKLEKELKGKGFPTVIVKVGKLFKVQTGAFGVKANAEAQVVKLGKAGYKAFVTS